MSALLFRSAIAALPVPQLESTIDFYVSELGFAIASRVDEDADRRCTLQKEHAQISFVESGAANPKGLQIEFEVGDVEACRNELSDKLRDSSTIGETSDRKILQFEDLNGYRIALVSRKPKSQFDKYFPESFSLETPRIILRPLAMEHIAELSQITAGEEIWTYFTKELHTIDGLTEWVAEAMIDKAARRRMPFLVFDKDAKRVAGSTSYGNISFPDKRVEIGWSWLGMEFMGTGVNKHAKFALLSFAFEVMGMERVEIKTDNLNERAKAALIKVGMKPEGVLRSHMQMHSNRRRDSIYFSILSSEWQERKENFFPEMM
jgi:N-acetyltransferase